MATAMCTTMNSQGLRALSRRSLVSTFPGISIGSRVGPAVPIARSGGPVLASAERDVRTAAVSTSAPPAEVASSPADKMKGAEWRKAKLEEEDFESSLEHKVLVGAAFGLCAALDIQGLASGDSISALGSAALAGYILSDIGSGVYHWLVDNYGSENTPVFGTQIKLFQGHHQRPWTITHREFCNNVHKICRPGIAVAGLALALPGPGWLDVFSSTFVALVICSQQFHAWSHMKKSELPPAVDALQSAGLLISRQAHGKHHLPPFEDNYCIVSGLWNPIMDKTGAFNKMERAMRSTPLRLGGGIC
mmetsp:Transcript_56743/g.179374  ORF Transcript_56743/g.179374 Transcript_56743/m.179374 type:complete len:305 (-) Transcript_56743:151-1065(-)